MKLPKVKDRIDVEIYYCICPHRRFLTLETSEWCSECDNWIDSESVGNATVYLHTDGNVKVRGSGYVELTQKHSLLCQNCEQPWPETETILPSGELGCPCQVKKSPKTGNHLPL